MTITEWILKLFRETIGWITPENIITYGMAAWAIFTFRSHTKQIKQENTTKNRANTIADETNHLKKIEINYNTQIQYIKHILPLHKECLNTLEALIALPIRNNPDYLNLRLKPIGTIEFDVHQPLIRETNNHPQNNALYFTVYNKIQMMQPEIECLFPDAKVECNEFMNAVTKLYDQVWDLRNEDTKIRHDSDVPAAWDATQTAYILLRNKLVQIIASSMNSTN